MDRARRHRSSSLRRRQSCSGGSDGHAELVVLQRCAPRRVAAPVHAAQHAPHAPPPCPARGARGRSSPCQRASPARPRCARLAAAPRGRLRAWYACTQRSVGWWARWVHARAAGSAGLRGGRGACARPRQHASWAWPPRSCQRPGGPRVRQQRCAAGLEVLQPCACARPRHARAPTSGSVHQRARHVAEPHSRRECSSEGGDAGHGERRVCQHRACTRQRHHWQRRRASTLARCRTGALARWYGNGACRVHRLRAVAPTCCRLLYLQLPI